MKTWIKVVLLLLCVSLLAATGCGTRSQPTPPTQQSAQQAPAHTMEDPVPIINQMNQSLDDIEAKVKATQMAQAKLQANNLVALMERLTPHFADMAFKDNLHRAVVALRDELNQPSPNQATTTGQVQSIRGMLKDTPAKLLKH